MKKDNGRFQISQAIASRVSELFALPSSKSSSAQSTATPTQTSFNRTSSRHSVPSGTQPIAGTFETPRVLGSTALEQIPYITNPNALEFILSELNPLMLSEQVSSGLNLQVELVTYLVKLFQQKPLNSLAVIQCFKRRLQRSASPYQTEGDIISTIIDRLFANVECLSNLIWKESLSQNDELVQEKEIVPQNNNNYEIQREPEEQIISENQLDQRRCIQLNQMLLKLLRLLVRGTFFSRKHSQDIFERVSSAVHPFKSQNILQCINILDQILGWSDFELLGNFPSSGLEPQNYFFFQGPGAGIHIHNRQQIIWPFTSGFSIIQWFKIEEEGSGTQECPLLFSFHSDGSGGCEAYFIGNKLYYRTVAPKYQPPSLNGNGVFLFEFEPRMWYQAAITHNKQSLSKPYLHVVINEKQVISIPVDYPKFSKQAIFTNGHIMKNFRGYLSNVLVFQGHIDVRKIQKIHSLYPLGFHSNRILRQLNNQEIFDKRVTSRMIIFYSPLRVVGNIAIDTACKIDGVFEANTGEYNSGQEAAKRIIKIGGLNALLPLLANLTRVDPVKQQMRESVGDGDEESDTYFHSPCVLNRYLKLLTSVLKSKYSLQSEQEAGQFFSILFDLISRLPSSQVNKESIETLSHLKLSLSEIEYKQQFVRNILSIPEFWLNLSLEVQIEFWNFIQSIYDSNPLQYNSIFPISKLVDIIINLSNSPKWFAAHGDESALNPDVSSSFAQRNQSVVNPLNSLQSYILPIIKIIESAIQNGGQEIAKEICCIARALAAPAPPCMHLLFLKLLKTLLCDSAGPNRHCASPTSFASYFQAENGFHILLYLCVKSTSDVKAMCIKLIDVLSSQGNMVKFRIDPDITSFLRVVLSPPKIETPRSQAMRQLPPISQQPQLAPINEIHDDMEFMRMGSQEQVFITRESQSQTIERDEIRRGEDQRFPIQLGRADAIPPPPPRSGKKLSLQFGFNEGTNDAFRSQIPFQQSTRGRNTSQNQEFLPKTAKFQESELTVDEVHLSQASPPMLRIGARQEQKEEPGKFLYEAEEEKIPPQPQFGISTFSRVPPLNQPRGGTGLSIIPSQQFGQTKVPPAPRNKKAQKFSFSGFASTFESNEEQGDDRQFQPPQFGIQESDQSGGFDVERKFLFNPELTIPSLKDRKFKTEERKLELKEQQPIHDEEGTQFTLRGREGQNPEFEEDMNSEAFEAQFNGDPTLTTCDLVAISAKTPITKPKFLKELDTDMINLHHPIGGEYGHFSDQYLQVQIKELAEKCLAWRRGEKVKEITKMPKFIRNERFMSRQNITTPSSKRTKNIEFSDKKQNRSQPPSRTAHSRSSFTSEESRPESTSPMSTSNSGDQNPIYSFHAHRTHQPLKQGQTGNSNQSIIVEELSPIATSKSGSSRGYDFPRNTLKSNQLYTPKSADGLSIETPKDGALPRHFGPGGQIMTIDQLIHEDVEEERGQPNLQNLYQSTLDWMLKRTPSDLHFCPMLDDCDSVCFTEALSILLPLVSQGDSFLIQRALQDFINLARWNQTNASILINHRLFHNWILELLLPLKVKQENCSLANTKTKYLMLLQQQSRRQQGAVDSTNKNILNADSLAIWDMGCKLHTMLMKTAISKEREGYKRINFLLRWRLAFQSGVSGTGGLISGLLVETKENAMHNLVSELWTMSSTSLYESCLALPAATQEHIIWKNIAHAAGMVEEFVLCSSSELSKTQEFGSGGVLDYVFGGEFSNTQASALRAPGSCFENIVPKLKGTISLKNGTASSGNSSSFITTRWADLEMVTEFLKLFDPIWDQKRKYSKSGEQQRSESDLHSQMAEVPRSQQQQAFQSNSITSPDSILQFMINAKKEHLSPTLQLLLQEELRSPSSSSINEFHHQTHIKLPESGAVETQQRYPLKSILNLMCLGITVSPYQYSPDNQSQPSEVICSLQSQLARLQNCTNFLMLVSQIWRFKENAFYTAGQKKLANCIAFVLTFLFHQIHRQRLQGTGDAITGSHQRVKLVQNTLTSLFISAFNILLFGPVRLTPHQVQNRSRFSAISELFSVRLLRYNDVENLFSDEKVQTYNKMDFDEFPDCFHEPTWKNLFFRNEKLIDLRVNQLNQDYMMSQIMPRRQAYRQKLQDSLASNQRVREDIMNRIHGEVMEVITNLGEKRFEEKNCAILVEEERRRGRAALWKKLWKKQILWRGVWRDKNLFDSNSEELNDILPLKYSSFQTHDRGRPVLSVRLNQFEYLSEEGEKQSKNRAIESAEILDHNEKQKRVFERLSYKLPDQRSGEDQQKVYLKAQLRHREIESLKHNYANIIFENICMAKRKEKKQLQIPCQIIKNLTIIRGTLFVTNYEIKFFVDITQTESKKEPESVLPFPSRERIAFFKYVHPRDKPFTKTWPLSYVRELQRRRFLTKKTAAEMFLIDNRSVLFNFANVDDRNTFTKKIVRLREKKCINLRYYESLEPKKILKKADFATAWSDWRLSNFEYLMMLNALSGRSYHDLSQYPVFPWIVTDYHSHNLDRNNGSIYRPLSLNMARLGSENRRQEFQRKYAHFDPSQLAQICNEWRHERYHFGSHYSNPGIVLHFLSRLFPMLEGVVELHDGKLDLPERSFYSIAQSFKSANNDLSDLRELTPQFYQIPELFLNKNNIKFGERKNQVQVHHVELPQWASSLSQFTRHDPYRFVSILRELLESDIVSEQLHRWIDLIFGYQSSGKEAERAMNKFHPLSYEDSPLDIDKVSNDMTRNSLEIQAYHFGQTPGQLFTRNHVPRNPRRLALKYRLVVDEEAKVKVFRPVVSSKKVAQRGQSRGIPSRSQISASAVLTAKFVSDSKIVGVINNASVVSYLWWPHAHDLNPNTPFTLCATEQPKSYSSQTRVGGLETSDRTFFRFDQLICVLNQGKYIARGGFWDGKIVVTPITDSEASVTYVSHHSTVTAMAVESRERFVITGAKEGDVIVWNILNTQGQHWVNHRHVHDHTAPVMSIAICERMLMFATASLDGVCNLYSLIKGKLLRTFLHPRGSPLHGVILSSSPLPSVAIFSEKEKTWTSFALNGKRLATVKEDAKHVVSPMVIRNSHFLDRMVYGNERGEVVIRSLPYLEVIRRNQVAVDAPVLTLLVDPTRRFLLVGCGDGGLEVITDPLKIQTLPGQNIALGRESNLGQIGGPNTRRSSAIGPSTTKEDEHSSQILSSSTSSLERDRVGLGSTLGGGTKKFE